MAVNIGEVNVAKPVPFKVMLWLLPPLTLKVTIAFGVPLKVITAVVPEQIVVVPEIVAVGKSSTWTTIWDRIPSQPFPSIEAA